MSIRNIAVLGLAILTLCSFVLVNQIENRRCGKTLAKQSVQREDGRVRELRGQVSDLKRQHAEALIQITATQQSAGRSQQEQQQRVDELKTQVARLTERYADAKLANETARTRLDVLTTRVNELAKELTVYERAYHAEHYKRIWRDHEAWYHEQRGGAPPMLLFLRIQKTGSTSMGAWLMRTYEREVVSLKNAITPNLWPAWPKGKRSALPWSVAPHCGLNIYRLGFTQKEWNMIPKVTVLRDPVTRIVSEFKYLMRPTQNHSIEEWGYHPDMPISGFLRENHTTMKLREFMSQPGPQPGCNRQTRYILGDAHYLMDSRRWFLPWRNNNEFHAKIRAHMRHLDHNVVTRPLDERDAQRAIEILETEFTHVSIIDMLHESDQMFYNNFKLNMKRLPKAPTMNRSTRRATRPPERAYDEALLKQLEECNAADRIVYEYFKDKLIKQHAKVFGNVTDTDEEHV